jgi:hypothetical protein
MELSRSVDRTQGVSLFNQDVFRCHPTRHLSVRPSLDCRGHSADTTQHCLHTASGTPSRLDCRISSATASANESRINAFILPAGILADPFRPDVVLCQLNTDGPTVRSGCPAAFWTDAIGQQTARQLTMSGEYFRCPFNRKHFRLNYNSDSVGHDDRLTHALQSVSRHRQPPCRLSQDVNGTGRIRSGPNRTWVWASVATCTRRVYTIERRPAVLSTSIVTSR